MRSSQIPVTFFVKEKPKKKNPKRVLKEAITQNSFSNKIMKRKRIEKNEDKLETDLTGCGYNLLMATIRFNISFYRETLVSGNRYIYSNRSNNIEHNPNPRAYLYAYNDDGDA